MATANQPSPLFIFSNRQHPALAFAVRFYLQIFGGEADEIFQAYHQAKYINEIAAAGKKEFAIPYYINVWIDYPAAQLAQRQIDLLVSDIRAATRCKNWWACGESSRPQYNNF